MLYASEKAKLLRGDVEPAKSPAAPVKVADDPVKVTDAPAPQPRTRRTSTKTNGGA